MNKERRLSDTEVIDIAENMTAAQRLKLIEHIADRGDEQSMRIARWLMDLHLADRAKPTVLH